MNIIDIMVYIRTQLDAAQRSVVEHELSHQQGVMSSRFNSDKTHMLMLTYNPDAISSAGLLRKITNMGLDARLVGL